MKRKISAVILSLCLILCTMAGMTTTVAGAVVHVHSLTHIEAQGATCTSDGNSEYWICTECGKYFSDSAATAEISQSDTVLSAKGHSLTHIEAQGATCTADGNSEYWICTECGKYFSDSAATAEISQSDTVLSAKGHSLTHIEAQEETCTSDGNREYWYCTECGKYFSDSAATAEISLSDTVISAKGHSYVDTVTEPTCTEQGYTTHKCSVCDYSYVDTYTTALGHSYESVVTAPTCTEGGYTTYTCSVCGDTYTADETEALGHIYEFKGFTWSGDLKSATATFVCSHDDNHVETVDAIVTSRNVFGVVTRTATVEFEGLTYTSDPVTTGTSLLVIGALTQTASEEVDSEETDSEEVDIIEPIEDTNSDTEPEEEPDIPAESNPTTGIAMAMLPMAVAVAGAIWCKPLRHG